MAVPVIQPEAFVYHSIFLSVCVAVVNSLPSSIPVNFLLTFEHNRRAILITYEKMNVMFVIVRCEKFIISTESKGIVSTH